MISALSIRCFLALLFLGLGVCDPAQAQSFVAFTGQVNSGGINVRVDSTVGSEIICTLAKGDLVEVVGESYDWYKIRLPKEAPAYIRQDLLECNNTATNNLNPGLNAPSSRCLSATVLKDKVNIRLAPSESSWILGKVDKATVVNVVSQRNGWFRIHPVYQSYGWVNKKFISKEIIEVKPVAVVVQPAISVNQAGESLVVQGVIGPYGVVLWRKATHKLATLDGKTYLLKGDRRSLNSLNGRKVQISGKLVRPVSGKYPIIQIDTIEVLE